jgi:hypothetical protein|tara:strand:- start:401 stop:571 length:171 start_codon:yes stop_codon:yes gene_type:complete
MMFYIQWLSQFNRWEKFTSYHHQPTAYKVASNRAKSTGKKHRIIDSSGQLVDLFNP